MAGIADEIESYPCRLCNDQVFLTSVGLEKHARKLHVENVKDVRFYFSSPSFSRIPICAAVTSASLQILREIREISEEWKRRNEERHRIREKIQAVRYR